MKISLNWVSDHVDLEGVSASRIADLLSLHTAEVEGIEVFGEAISGVVVGRVVSCGPHPDADKLSLTLVDYGAGEPVPVVCGASNVRQGLKVAFAPVGSRLRDLKIKQAKLRGQISQGMICSERELELSDEHEGILELAEDAPIGVAVVEYLGLTDHVLELDNKSLTHRPDLWGHYGFARELAALLERPLKPLDIGVAWPDSTSAWSIQRQDHEGCPQYGAVEIDLGSVPGISGIDIRRRLLAVGQRPLNDIVDLSNYVLLEIGQPTHAFDAGTLEGHRIEIRGALAGETFTTLDHREHRLVPEDLVVADGNGAVALAGVMGGLATEVTATTTRILLESAVFHPTRVRRTAQRLALRSEASSRFEKSLDPDYAALATARFCHLLLQARPEARILHAPVVDGEVAGLEIRLPLDLERTSALLGIPLVDAEVVEDLEALGFQVEAQESAYQVVVPSWRATKDVTLPIDLVEEVGRMHGYHHIQPVALIAPIQAPVQLPQRLLARRLSTRLVLAHGAHETQSYSFLDHAWAARLGRSPEDFERLCNPVQAQVDLVRRDPVPSLLEQAAHNLRECAQGRLCEVAKGYEACGGAEPRQRHWLGLIEWGAQDLPREGEESLFGRLRSVALDLLTGIGVAAPHITASPQQEGLDLPDWAHPVQTLHWTLGERLVGWTCRVNPRLLRELDFVHSDAAVLLFDLQVLGAVAEEVPAHFRAPARFPGIKLDIALALPVGLPFATVEASLRRAGGKLLESMALFDVYTGPGLAEDQRSLAFRCLLRAPDRTLSDKEEQKFLRMVAQVAAELGGNLRS